MKAFTYRLETLLHLREIARDKALAKYAESINSRQHFESELKKSELNLESLQIQIGNQRKVFFAGFEQASFNRSILLAKEMIIDVNKKLQEAIQREATKKKIYLQADSAFKSLLKLKDKKHREHLYAENLKEERELEDIIGGRFVFNTLTKQ